VNQLSGSIPPELGNLSNLWYIQLGNNQLSGSIPPQFSNLHNLDEIDLGDNQLSGSIPPDLGNLNYLDEIDLGNNQLSGSIPPQLGNLSNLTQLSLHNNQLNGTIPPQLGNLSKLEGLYLLKNQLSGNIPSKLGNLSNLNWLYLNQNQLSGSIPPELGNLSNLYSLSLYGNQLSGSIPPELGNLRFLGALDLSDNQLSGSMPPELGNMHSLYYLNIQSNQLLYEPLPLSLTNLTQLDFFYFTNTNLCERTDPSFQMWLSGIGNLESSGKVCITSPPVLISPSGVIDTNTPTLKWNKIATATEYKITLFSVAGGSNVFSQNVTTSSACTYGVCKYTSPTPLSQGEYRFKVIAKNAFGWGPVSAWMKFRYGKPAAPVLISPDGFTSDTTPTYKWNASDGAKRYKVVVYSHTSSSTVHIANLHFSGICSGGVCSYTPATTLSAGKYHFTVRAYNKAGWGPSSAWKVFDVLTSPPVAPTLISPNGVIADSTPTYKWNIVATATNYRLSVYSVTTSSYLFTMNVTASSACWGGVCKYTSSTPLSQGEYRFKVSGYNLVGWGPASAWMNFRYGKPAAPVLISPNSAIADTTPTYKWNASDGAKRYKLVVYSHTTSSAVVNANLLSSAVCSGGVCSYTPATTLSAGKYHFTVRAYNKAGWGPSSAWKVFDVLTSPPTAPTLISPNGVIADSTPTYKWNNVATATKYRLSVYSVTSSSYVLTLNVTASGACWGGVCKYTSSTPLSQGNYKFKVSAYNVIGWGPVSSWMSFRYGIPAAPVLISPSGPISDTTPVYTWNVSESATRYKLMVYSISSGSNILTMNLHKSGICSGGVCSYTQPSALSAGDYKFKMRAYNKAGWGPVSTWMSFTVSP
jgi:hypothetical protein